MKLKEIAKMIDRVTPFTIVDTETDIILWKSWEDDDNDIPDIDIYDTDNCIYWNNTLKHLVIYVEQ